MSLRAAGLAEETVLGLPAINRRGATLGGIFWSTIRLRLGWCFIFCGGVVVALAFFFQNVIAAAYGPEVRRILAAVTDLPAAVPPAGTVACLVERSDLGGATYSGP